MPQHDPSKANEGTIRAKYAISKGENSVQKPITTNLKEANELVQLAKDNNLVGRRTR